MPLTLRTPAFAADRSIPPQFTREGANVSPLLEWEGAPRGTRSYALVVEDPDAPRGTFRHWAAYNIPADTHRLPEGAGSRDRGAAMTMAANDFGNARYDGPQPPPGHGAHHYHFRLFALDVPELELQEGCSAADVVAAAEARSLAHAEAVGTFEKS